MIKRPICVDKIMAYVNTPFVKILTGIRRGYEVYVGKLDSSEIDFIAVK